MTILLIDSDILVYRVGFAAETESEGIAVSRMEESVRTMCEKTQADHYLAYLTSTDKSNFRYELCPSYKANRTQPKPKHYDVLREFLIDRHKAIVVYGEEADDRLGITQGEDTVIGSIDKDLDQIPGKHYNFVKDIHYEITPEQGVWKFYEQLLIGDKTDNIPGIYGIGPKTAYKALEGKSGYLDMYRAVREAWKAAKAAQEEAIEKGTLKHGPFDYSEEQMILSGKLLKIRQKEGEIWEPPVE